MQHGGGTHQIDDVVRGQDRLFVIETKTWRGEIEGRAGGQTWTLHRPRRREAITVYNPLFQNQTDADVINAMTGVPVTPLVVSTGFLTVPPELAERVLGLPGRSALLAAPGAPTGRIERAFEVLARRKAAWGQKVLAARHIRWMRASRRFDPLHPLWVASAVCLVCAAFTEQGLLSAWFILHWPRYSNIFFRYSNI